MNPPSPFLKGIKATECHIMRQLIPQIMQPAKDVLRFWPYCQAIPLDEFWCHDRKMLLPTHFSTPSICHALTPRAFPKLTSHKCYSLSLQERCSSSLITLVAPRAPSPGLQGEKGAARTIARIPHGAAPQTCTEIQVHSIHSFSSRHLHRCHHPPVKADGPKQHWLFLQGN